MKNCELLINEYLEFLKENFSCRTENNFIVLETPYQYIDGDFIDLYIEQVTDFVRVSDLGESTRKLSDMGFNLKNKSSKVLLNKIIKTTGISSTRGILYFRVSEEKQLNQNIYFLIRAIQQIDSLIFSQKQMFIDDFAIEVEEFLIKKGINPIKNIPISGHSKKEYRIPIFINHDANLLIKPLSSPTPSGEFDQIARITTAYLDINKLYPHYQRAIILNDREIAWEPENISIAESVVDIPLGFWTQRDDFINNISHLLKL